MPFVAASSDESRATFAITVGSFFSTAWIWARSFFACPSFCDPALLERPMLQHVLKDAGIPYIAFKYAENSGQMQPIREQAGTFSDSIKLWSAP